MDELDEQIRRTRAGDLDAFEGIVRAFESPIRSWVAARCPPGVDADDVAQATFVEAFRRLGEFEPGTDLRAWLFTIARYRLMAECTKLRRLADYHSRYMPLALAQEMERRTIQEDPAEDRRLELLRDCLGRVNDAGAEVLRMRYAEDQPLDRIAARTGRSLASVKKRLFVLRQKLHDCIAGKLTGGLV